MEIEPGNFGIGYETFGGKEGAGLIGSREEAAHIVAMINALIRDRSRTTDLSWLGIR